MKKNLLYIWVFLGTLIGAEMLLPNGDDEPRETKKKVQVELESKKSRNHIEPAGR